MAKLYASEAAMFATWAAVQTLGGFGLLARVPGREVVPRREARGDLGGHVRHPAPDHRARSGAGRRVSEGRDLEPLFAPRSIAVAGASTEPGVVGVLARAGRARGGRPAAGPPRQPTRWRAVRQAPARARCATLDGEADLVVVACPSGRSRTPWRRRSPPVRARSSSSPPGSASATRRVARASWRCAIACAAAGALMLGPNCIGIFDAPRTCASRPTSIRPARSG